MVSKAVLIGGLDRTGKTYLRFILESHPEIIFSKRTSLWTKYYNKYGSLEKNENLDKILSVLTKNKHVMALSTDFNQLKTDFQQGATTYERFFALIHQQYAEKNEKIYWGDQSESLENYAAIILKAYPYAKFIQMVRDPRDRFAAILKKPSNHRQELGIATARWLTSIKLAIKNRLAFPDRYVVIRYETKVSDLENTTKKVCDFLGLNYEPSMLRLEQVPRFKNQDLGGYKFSSPITNQYVGQYRRDLSSSQTVFIEKFSQKYMKEFQYQMNEGQSTDRHSIIEYLKTWPINIMKMAGWNLVSQEGRV